MHSLRTRRGLAGLAGAAGLASAAGILGAAVPAQAAAPSAGVAARAAAGSTVTSDTAIRLVGLGSAANKVTVSGFGPDRFLVTDTHPIKAGAGCAARTVPAGLFGVTCRAPVNAEGEFLRFFVDLGAGKDSVTNLAPAPMSAKGGVGDDLMTGGSLDDDFSDTSGANTIHGRSGADLVDTSSSTDLLPDTLDGGRGDDDLFAGGSKDTLTGGSGDDDMQGGLGADQIDGGPGRDHASYTDSAHGSVRLSVSLDGVANDGQLPLGGTSEGDNVTTSVEDVTGNGGPDLLFGNTSDNRLVGLGGSDFIEGRDGDDELEGDSGADSLFSNTFRVALSDGDVDVLDGGTDEPDACRVSTFDGDLTQGCEIIDVT
jgi:Ca2+-binding RTX toxin-like protein